MSEITEYPAGKVAYIKRSIAVAYEAHRIRVNAVAPAVTVMARTNYQA